MPGVLDTGICDPDELFLIYGVKRLQGFGPGQFWTATRRAKAFVAEEGTDGAVTISKMPSRLWDGQLTLSQSSSSNDVLYDLLKAAENVPGGVFHPFAMSHGSTKLVAAVAIIDGDPVIARSAGADVYVWSFILAGFDGKLRSLRSAVAS